MKCLIFWLCFNSIHGITLLHIYMQTIQDIDPNYYLTNRTNVFVHPLNSIWIELKWMPVLWRVFGSKIKKVLKIWITFEKSKKDGSKSLHTLKWLSIIKLRANRRLRGISFQSPIDSSSKHLQSNLEVYFTYSPTRFHCKIP